MENNNKPFFHQIVIADYLTHRLKIPPQFMKHLTEDMAGKATVEATIKSVGGSWQVKLVKRDKYTFIEEGWPTVMQDNALGDNEFLLFRYDGQMCFNMQIFERTGCERVRAAAPAAVTPPMEQETELAFASENPQFKIRLKAYNVQKQFLLRLPREMSPRLASKPQKRTIMVENAEGEEWEVTLIMNMGVHCLCGGWRSFVRANNLHIGDDCILELLGPTKIRVLKP